jgi:hypothetical protein
MIKFDEDFVDLSEMANIRPADTGLTMCIYVSDKDNVRSQHRARIKVSKTYGDKISKSNLFVITVSDNPEVIGNTGDIKEKDIKEVKNFIIKNKQVLIDYWNLIIGIGELLRKLK